VIGRVLKRGSNLARLLYYLYGPGKACEHVNPHLVGGWRHPAELEPPLRPDGRRDFRRLTGLLELPLALLGDRAPADPVWHCVVRAAPGDPDLGDGAWMRIAGEVMHRTGLSRYGEEDEGVRWVAVHHGDNHIHIVATLARQDGGRAALHNEYWRIGEALRDMEAEYGLVVVARADRTAARRPTRAEAEKAARAGQAEPPRVTLCRHVRAAAAAARSEADFFAALDRRGVQSRLRHSERDPGEVTGYAVTLPGARTAAGSPVWFGGGKLAPDLTLPKLRRRWPGPGPARQQAGPARQQAGPARQQVRLDGHGMTDSAARAALRREVGMCAARARSEAEFFAALDAAGLLIRTRPGPARAGEAAGYAVSLPGLVHSRDGEQVWYGGQTLSGQLALGTLRRRWQAGRAGAPPAAAFAGAEAGDIFGHAAQAAAEAARLLRAAPGPGQAADIAWAAADVLTAAADATGSTELRRAADVFDRAARAPWGRTPPPSLAGAGLRTAAYLVAGCTPAGTRRRITRLALISTLKGLAGTVAELHQAQGRLLQAAAARRAAATLAATETAWQAAWTPLRPVPAETAGPPVTARPAPGRAARPRPPRHAPQPGAPPGRRRAR
jgi:hypothetical protein